MLSISPQKAIQLDSLPSFCSSNMNNNEYQQSGVAPSVPTQSDNDEASLHGLFRSKGGCSPYQGDQSDSGDSINNTKSYQQHSKNSSNRSDRASTFFNNSQASSGTLKSSGASSRQIATKGFEEHKKQQSNTNNEFSAADDNTYSKSQKTGEYQDSYSDDEDAVYIPFEYSGDGRKREAKRHKMMAMVAKDEIEIDRMVRDYQNANLQIIESENALEDLRSLDISKKELQGKRNRLTAKLSRDR